MVSHWSEIRTLLQKKPTREHWDSLLELIEELPEDAQQMAAAYIQKHLSSWPCYLRPVRLQSAEFMYSERTQESLLIVEEDLQHCTPEELYAHVKTARYVSFEHAASVFQDRNFEPFLVHFIARHCMESSFLVHQGRLVFWDAQDAVFLLVELPKQIKALQFDTRRLALLFENGDLCVFEDGDVRRDRIELNYPIHEASIAACGTCVLVASQANTIEAPPEAYIFPQLYEKQVTQDAWRIHSLEFEAPDPYEAGIGLSCAADGRSFVHGFVTGQDYGAEGSVGYPMAGFILSGRGLQEIYTDIDTRYQNEFYFSKFFCGPHGCCLVSWSADKDVHVRQMTTEVSIYWSFEKSEAESRLTTTEWRMFEVGHKAVVYCSFSPCGNAVGLIDDMGDAWLILRSDRDVRRMKVAHGMWALDLHAFPKIHGIDSQCTLHLLEHDVEAGELLEGYVW